MPRHWLTIVILIALLAAALLLLDSQPEVLQPSAREEGEEQLTSYLTGVETAQYGEDGRLEYHFRAERMSHFQPDPQGSSSADYTTISKPFFTFYRPNESPWHMEARRGHSTDDGDVVVLQEEVRVWQDDPALGPNQITTSELLIRPKRQVAETDQFVMIRYPRILTTGVGMRADLAEETFSILSEGSTIYDPTP